MKTIIKLGIISIFIFGTTSSVFASWWNPLSWNVFRGQNKIESSKTVTSEPVIKKETQEVDNLLSCNGSKYNKCPEGQTFTCPTNGEDAFCDKNKVDEIKTPKLKQGSLIGSVKTKETPIKLTKTEPEAKYGVKTPIEEKIKNTPVIKNDTSLVQGKNYKDDLVSLYLKEIDHFGSVTKLFNYSAKILPARIKEMEDNNLKSLTLRSADDTPIIKQLTVKSYNTIKYHVEILKKIIPASEQEIIDRNNALDVLNKDYLEISSKTFISEAEYEFRKKLISDIVNHRYNPTQDSVSDLLTQLTEEESKIDTLLISVIEKEISNIDAELAASKLESEIRKAYVPPVFVPYKAPATSGNISCHITHDGSKSETICSEYGTGKTMICNLSRDGIRGDTQNCYFR